MPSLTLGTLLSECTAALGQRLDLTPSQLSLHANLAQQEVSVMLPHTALMDTATIVLNLGSGSTNLPADYGECVDMTRTNSYDSFGFRVLTLVPPREIDNASEGTQNGRTNRYAVSGQTLLFYPTSGSTDTFTMRYIKIPADMSNLTDRPSLHTRYHPAVLYKFMENMADRVVDNQRAAYFRNKFISVMGTVPNPSDVQNRSERTYP